MARSTSFSTSVVDAHVAVSLRASSMFTSSPLAAFSEADVLSDDAVLSVSVPSFPPQAVSAAHIASAAAAAIILLIFFFIAIISRLFSHFFGKRRSRSSLRICACILRTCASRQASHARVKTSMPQVCKASAQIFYCNDYPLCTRE